MKPVSLWLGPVLAGVFLLGCDGQQYVSPATVGLVVTDDATARQRVNRCHYVPVLLGSQIKFRYEVDGDLSATLTLTRRDLQVDFEPDSAAAPLHATIELIDGTLALSRDEDWESPAGYSVDLVGGCEPGNEYDP